MSNRNYDSLALTQQRQAKALATFARLNLGRYMFGDQPSDANTLVQVRIGKQEGCCAVEVVCNPVCSTEDLAIIFPLDVADIATIEGILNDITGQTITIPLPPDGYPYLYYLFAFYPPLCNAQTRQLNIIADGNPVDNTQYDLGVFTYIGSGPYGDNASTGFIVYYPVQDVLSLTIESAVVAISNQCSSRQVDVTFGCFLEGSPVTMADGTTKAIENIVVGDVVRGAFGESNTVLGLHRPMLGSGTIVDINNEHKTTRHHPHVSPDFTFACIDPHIITNLTYGKKHVIIKEGGVRETQIMQGVNPERIRKLEVGTVLQTGNGPKTVESITDIRMSPMTQVYHLVVGGSHTYIVDNYAVSAWPNEVDFNYDTWTPK
jgi:hypothetical protein